MSSDKNDSLSVVVGRNIAYRRKLLGYTQDDFADMLKITAAALSRIESGRFAPRFTRLGDIASYLGCRVEDLFKEDDNPDTMELDIVRELLHSLPKETQSDLLRLIVDMIQVLKRSMNP